MPDRVVITGGAGFVGSTIAFELKRKFPRADITAFDNLKRRGSELNVSRLKRAGVRFIYGDVRQPSDLEALAPDLIIECSAEPSAQAGYESAPDYAVQTNLFGCYNCLNLARRTKADFIFLSTSRVYPVAPLNGLSFRETETRFEWLDGQEITGASRAGISESFPTEGLRSIYGMTKLASELMIQEFADTYGFRYAINRCGLIAGPWQMGKIDQGVAALWLAAHYFGHPLRYIGFGGQGKQVRDILHVDDLAELLAMQAANMAGFDRRTLNCGGGPEFTLSLLEMTALCEELTGRRIALGSEPATRRADIRIYVTDSRKLEEAYGWKPARSPIVVLADILKWLRKNESEVVEALFAATA